jgi:hypothetical protein
MRDGRMKSTGSVTSFLDGTNGSGIILRTVTSILTLSSLSMSLIEVMCLVALSTIHPPKNAKHIIPRRFAVFTHQGRPACDFQSSVEEVTTAPNKHMEPERKVAVRKPACEGALYRRVSPESYRHLARFCFCIFCAVLALETLGSSVCAGSLVARVFGGGCWEPLAGPFWPSFTGSFVDLAEAEEKCWFSDCLNFVQRKALRKRTGLANCTASKDILTAVKGVGHLQSSLFEAH